MKKLIVLLLLSFAIQKSHAQITTKINGDSVKVSQTGGLPAELIIENSTKGKKGAFLRNKGNGRTEFAFAVDSIYTSKDTFYYRYAGQWNFKIIPDSVGSYTPGTPQIIPSDTAFIVGKSAGAPIAGDSIFKVPNGQNWKIRLKRGKVDLLQIDDGGPWYEKRFGTDTLMLHNSIWHAGESVKIEYYSLSNMAVPDGTSLFVKPGYILFTNDNRRFLIN